MLGDSSVCLTHPYFLFHLHHHPYCSRCWTSWAELNDSGTKQSWHQTKSANIIERHPLEIPFFCPHPKCHTCPSGPVWFPLRTPDLVTVEWPFVYANRTAQAMLLHLQRVILPTSRQCTPTASFVNILSVITRNCSIGETPSNRLR